MLAYLITHAATAQEPLREADAWELATTGQVQVERLAAAPFWATVTQVVVSSEPKTLATVSGIVARRTLPVWTDCRLDELRRTGWVDDYGAHVAQVFARPDLSVGGWETASRALRRVCGAMATAERRFWGQTIAVVGHGLSLSLLRAYYLGYAQARFDDWARLAFGSTAAVELPEGRFAQDFPRAVAAQRV